MMILAFATEQRLHIKAWVDALRSGQFSQTTGKLRDVGGGRCCLGVACDVYHQETHQGTWEEAKLGDDGIPFVDGNNNRQTGAMPPAVVQWLGLSSGDPIVQITVDDDDVENECSLSICNDDKEMDFDQIADAIERTYLK
jgi:hypothetical protein